MPGWDNGSIVSSWLGRQDSNLRMPVPKTGAILCITKEILRNAQVIHKQKSITYEHSAECRRPPDGHKKAAAGLVPQATAETKSERATGLGRDNPNPNRVQLIVEAFGVSLLTARILADLPRKEIAA